MLRSAPFSLRTMSASCVRVEPPRVAVRAPVAVVQAATSTGPCDEVTASAEASFGNLGRSLSYQWTLLSMQGTGVLTADVAQVENHLAGPAGKRASITLPQAATALANNVTLKVTVVNFLAADAGVSTVTIRRVVENVPRISIVGGELVQGSALRPLVL